MDKESLIDLSQKYEMKLIAISYDTGMGYISKVVLDNGELSDYTTTFFSMDIEVELVEKSNSSIEYYRELIKYMESNGTNKSINAINM